MTDQVGCHICGNSSCKYCCPRCNIPYCSLACYRSEKHLQCSEIFYQKWVQEELKSCESDPEAKQKMLEILKQQTQESDTEESLDSDDDEEETLPDLASRMQDVNLDDDEAIWQKLTAEEKKEFKKLIATGSIIKILPEWEPWWKSKKRKALVQECGVEGCTEEEFCPPILSDVPQLSKLTKTEPSSNIAFMVWNVLQTYAFTVRWFKGNHANMVVEAISTCIALSATLRHNQIFTNVLEAFLSFEDDLSKCEWLKNETFDKNMLQEDVIDIILMPGKEDSYHCVKAALSDLNFLCTQAIATLKESKSNHLKRFSGPTPKTSQLQLISKKLIYYLSWTTDYGHLLANICQSLTI